MIKIFNKLKEQQENLKKSVLKEMRKPEVNSEKIIKYVEENLEDAFNYACRKNLSVNEWQPDSRYGKQLNQKTVFITVRIFNLWETAVVDVLCEHLKKKFRGIQVERVNDPIGDLKIILPNNEEIRWEIKSSQAKDSFTGATHSASKCNDYIFINYAIDKNLKLKENIRNKGFITELAVFVWDDMEAKWIGEPSKNNSFTSLRIPSETKEKRPEIVVIGDLEPKKSWCKIIRKKLI